MEEHLSTVYSGIAYLLLFVIIFFIAKLINDFLVPYNVDEQLVIHDNPALAVSLSGYLLAVIIIYIGALLGPGEGLGLDMLNIGGYSFLGIIFLNFSRFINDKIILRKFSNTKEIIEDRNIGVGAVQFGSYIATGLIIAGSIHGEGGGFLTAIVFFLLGQLALIIFSEVYNFITPFDIHVELEKDNNAAGVAFGGTLVALGIILLSALSGVFEGWKSNLIYFGVDLIVGCVTLPIFRLFLDKVIIAKSDLNHEIKEDRNIGAAILEMTIAIGFASIIFFVLRD